MNIFKRNLLSITENYISNDMSSNINSAFLNVLHNKGLKSITEISEITGLDQATVSRHVHRKQPLNQNHIEVYSKKLKVT